MSKNIEIRGTWKQLLTGKIAAFFVKVLGFTLRYRLDDPHGISGTINSDNPGVWVFWHNGLLAAPLIVRRVVGDSPASTLTSASKDGAVIASFTECFGVSSVRGSSSRRAVAALIALKRALRKGNQIYITPDGPRGPRYSMEVGVVKLAQSSGAPLYPVRFSYSASWRTKTWDRLHIPKPFSRLTMHVEAPISIPAELDDEAFESCRKNVENILRQGIDDFPPTKSPQ